MFGVDVFGYMSDLYNADEELPKDGPNFQSISTGGAIKENLGSGGRWGENGKSFTLLDEDHMYLVFNPGYEVTILVRDLESGTESIKTANASMPILQVGNQNAVIRLKSLKTPEGETFDYNTTPTI
jgi:hypothetical protein